MKKIKLTHVACFTGLLAVAGCQEYHIRHEGVTTHAGNHLAVNEAQMVVDPWKRNAYNTHTHGDGKRSSDIIKKYRNQHAAKSGGKGGSGGSGASAPVSPPSQSN